MNHIELLSKLLKEALQAHQELEQRMKDSEEVSNMRYKAIKDALGGRYYDFRDVLVHIEKLLENQK
jgi:hypothetical protein